MLYACNSESTFLYNPRYWNSLFGFIWYIVEPLANRPRALQRTGTLASLPGLCPKATNLENTRRIPHFFFGCFPIFGISQAPSKLHHDSHDIDQPFESKRSRAAQSSRHVLDVTAWWPWWLPLGPSNDVWPFLTLLTRSYTHHVISYIYIYIYTLYVCMCIYIYCMYV